MYMCRFSCEHTFSAHLGEQAHWVSMVAGFYGKKMFSFVRNLKCSSKMTVPFCITLSNKWEFLLLHILVSIWWCQHLVVSVFSILAILIGVQQYLILICISFITYDVEHHFLCLFAFCISSLVRCLLRSFVLFFFFFNSVVRFLLLLF